MTLLYEQPLFWILLIIGIILLTAYIIIWYFRGKVRKLEKKKEEERIAEELNMATSIQAGALPSIFPAFPDRKEFDIYASMTPAKEVGGDFYDFFMVDDNHLGMVIADVSDKGIPAALFMMSSKMIISSHAKMGKLHIVFYQCMCTYEYVDFASGEVAKYLLATFALDTASK